MNQKKPYPSGFDPVNDYILCGSRLTNTQVPIEVYGTAPLLIGTGVIPRLWLYSPTDGKFQSWIPVVLDNKAQVNGVVVQKQQPYTISIEAGSTTLLRIQFLKGTPITVTHIDFRPIGLNIYGDGTSIKMGSGVISGSHIENCRVGIGLGD